MKYSIVRLSFGLFFIIFPLFVFSQKEEKQILIWQNGKKLSWRDFQGQEPTKHFEGAAAETATKINCTYSFKNDTLKYLIYTVFDKTESWTKIFTDYALAHEQNHFNISEIVTRRLRKYFQEAQISNTKNSKDNFKMNVQKIINSEPALQNEYDKQTKFGLDSSQQYKWNRYVIKTLDSLKSFTQISGKKILTFSSQDR